MRKPEMHLITFHKGLKPLLSHAVNRIEQLGARVCHTHDGMAEHGTPYVVLHDYKDEYIGALSYEPDNKRFVFSMNDNMPEQGVVISAATEAEMITALA